MSVSFVEEFSKESMICSIGILKGLLEFVVRGTPILFKVEIKEGLLEVSLPIIIS